MKLALPVFICWFLSILFFNRPVLATIEFKIDGIENNPAEINYDQTIEVLYSFSGVSPPKTYYLSGAFQKEAGSNYFGYTWNNNWYKYGNEFTNFFKLEINDTTASGQLKLKPDIENSGFKGTGDYQLKLFRYCTSQNSCGDTNFVSLKIIAPPSPSPLASPEPSGGGGSPSPNPAPTPSSLASSSPSPTPQPSKIYRIQDIVLLNRETPEPVLGTHSGQPVNPVDWQLALMLITAGTGLLLVTAIIIVRLWRKN